MNELLEMMTCVRILADDLHYQSSGLAFYGNHLLADKVKDGLDGTMDELREAYWLGELKALPPSTDDTFAGAVERARAIRESFGADDRNKALVIRLKEAVDLVLKNIEQIKLEMNGQLMSGTVAILDGLSSHMLIMYGLLERTSR